MPTTTISAIRIGQAALIRALSPSSQSTRKFVEYEQREDFQLWAEANPTSALRRFSIEDDATYETPLGSDTDSEEIETQMTVTIAYPHDTRYGSGKPQDQRDVMREDLHQIDTAIGHRGSAGYVSGQRAAVADAKEFDDGDGVDFLRLTYQINFRRAF